MFIYHVNYICLALIQLSNGNTTTDGYLELYFQGEWYTTCGSYASEYNAAVVCRELGYEGGGTASLRLRDYTIHNHLLWYDLYCNRNDDSVFDCGKCCGQFYEGYRSCSRIPEYACQSKSSLCWL